MSTAWEHDLPPLIAAVQQGFGIPVESLRLLQRGWGGACYLAETAAGDRFFLKVSEDATSDETAASSRSFYLPLMQQLHAKGILPYMPYPLRTLRGDFWLERGARQLVITPFIEAETVGFGPLPAAIVARLAELIGILHSSLPQLEFEQPFVEQFDFPHAAPLLASVAALEAVTPGDSPGRQGLRQALLPHRQALLAALDRLETLGAQARAIGKPLVVCHTDLHGANLMLDAQGNLYLLDWETAVIAPPEHDMIFFAGEPNFFELFWPNYRRHFPAAALDCDLLAFYYYRRALEDIAGLVFRLLRGDGGEARDRADIGDLEGSLQGLATLDATVIAVRQRWQAFHLPHLGKPASPPQA